MDIRLRQRLRAGMMPLMRPVIALLAIKARRSRWARLPEFRN